MRFGVEASNEIRENVDTKVSLVTVSLHLFVVTYFLHHHYLVLKSNDDDV
jgi:hypothetical protein